MLAISIARIFRLSQHQAQTRFESILCGLFLFNQATVIKSVEFSFIFHDVRFKSSAVGSETFILGYLSPPKSPPPPLPEIRTTRALHLHRMHASALLVRLTVIVTPLAVLSAPEHGRGGYPRQYGHLGVASSPTTTVRLSPDPELASRVSEYVAHQRTRSLSNQSAETPSSTSRGCSIVNSETTTSQISINQAAIVTAAVGPYSITTVKDGVVVIATSRGYAI